MKLNTVKSKSRKYIREISWEETVGTLFVRSKFSRRVNNSSSI